ncbi:MAG: SRPBCC family protein [Planctomycetes bacterium]|nr:SRPBCC family protein [Planctomycetota bacterium]
MRTWQLRSRLWIPRPPDEVFPFFAAAENLSRLTPPWLRFRIESPTPIPMGDGALIDYRIGVRGVPMRWRTRIAAWDPPHRFVDEQLRGPYARWHHTHTFTARDGGTELGDLVDMRPRGGPLAGLLMAAIVRRDVERIFRYRSRVMAELFGGDPAAAELSWHGATHVPKT